MSIKRSYFPIWLALVTAAVTCQIVDAFPASEIPSFSDLIDDKQSQPTGDDSKRDKKTTKLNKFNLPSLLKDQPPEAVNGVTCRIGNKLLPEKTSLKVILEWSIKYDGPRPPLVILKPALERSGQPDETQITFFAVGKDGEFYAKTFSNPVSFSMWQPDKKDFINVEKNNTFSDKIVVPLDDIRDGFCLAAPENFNVLDSPSIIYVKMYLKTFARGEDLGLDAWTGGYETNLTSFKLTSWK